MPSGYRLTRYRGKFAITWVGDDGQRYRRSTGTDDRETAQQILEEFVRRSREAGKRRPYRVEEIWDAFRTNLGTRPAAITMGHDWKALKDRFGALRADDLLDVDPSTHLTIAEILSAEHIAERRKAGRKDGTILTELSRLRTVCNWAAQRRMMKAAPKWSMPPMPPCPHPSPLAAAIRKVPGKHSYFALTAVRYSGDCDWRSHERNPGYHLGSDRFRARTHSPR